MESLFIRILVMTALDFAHYRLYNQRLTGQKMAPNQDYASVKWALGIRLPSIASPAKLFYTSAIFEPSTGLAVSSLLIHQHFCRL